jgi:hypothetical protein
MTHARGESAALLLVAVAVVPVYAEVCGADYMVNTDRGKFQVASGPLATEGLNTQHTEAQEVDFGSFNVRVEWQEVKWANEASSSGVVSEGAGSIYGFDAEPPSIGNGMAYTFNVPIRSLGLDIVDLSSAICA